MTGKQGKCQWCPEIDHSAGGCQASSQFFCEDTGNEYYDIAEEPATTQVKEETTRSLRARDVQAPATLRTFTHTERKRRNGSRPVGYSGQAALKRKQCNITTEGRDITRLQHSKHQCNNDCTCKRAIAFSVCSAQIPSSPHNRIVGSSGFCVICAEAI
jgi:hypothetical protein